MEEVETSKLITSRDVCFIEDESPRDLALIEGGGVRPTTTELKQFPSSNTESSPSAPVPAPIVIPATPAALSDTLSSDTNAESSPNTPVSQKRITKWEHLKGTREPSTHVRTPTSRFGQPAVTLPDNESAPETILSTSQSRAYVVFSGEPTTYHQVMRSPHSMEWEKAIQAEYDQLKSTKTFEWVPAPPEGRKAVGSRIVFREKRDGQGNITKFKARIVAKGFSQVPGRDFNPLFISSSVFRTTTFRTLMSLVAHEDWKIHQVDVVGAYLQGNLDEEIYMEVPKGIKEKGKENWCWKLVKALYGLKQAGRQ